jgi:hypothetical protein
LLKDVNRGKTAPPAWELEPNAAAATPSPRTHAPARPPEAAGLVIAKLRARLERAKNQSLSLQVDVEALFNDLTRELSDHATKSEDLARRLRDVEDARTDLVKALAGSAARCERLEREAKALREANERLDAEGKALREANEVLAAPPEGPAAAASSTEPLPESKASG